MAETGKRIQGIVPMHLELTDSFNGDFNSSEPLQLVKKWWADGEHWKWDVQGPSLQVSLYGLLHRIEITGLAGKPIKKVK
jgi:hypothetical protein